MFERPLEGWRGEGRVDDDDQPRGVGRLRQRANIEHVSGRIDRGFEIEKATFRCDRALKRLGLREVDFDQIGSKPRQAFFGQRPRVRVERLVDDDLVAQVHQRQEQRGDGGHARRRDDGRLSALKIGDPALEQILRRIMFAAIKEAGLLVGDHRVGGVDIGKCEGRGHVDRRRHSAAVFQRRVAGVNGAGLEAQGPIGTMRAHCIGPESGMAER